jgi:hypothetical protein
MGSDQGLQTPVSIPNGPYSSVYSRYAITVSMLCVRAQLGKSLGERTLVHSNARFRQHSILQVRAR